jgi:hypothetical protein
MKYWVYQNANIEGPYDIEDLKKRRDISPSTLVCSADKTGDNPLDWQSVQSVLEVSHVPSSSSHPSETPQSGFKNKIEEFYQNKFHTSKDKAYESDKYFEPNGNGAHNQPDKEAQEEISETKLLEERLKSAELKIKRQMEEFDKLKEAYLSGKLPDGSMAKLEINLSPEQIPAIQTRKKPAEMGLAEPSWFKNVETNDILQEIASNNFFAISDDLEESEDDTEEEEDEDYSYAEDSDSEDSQGKDEVDEDDDEGKETEVKPTQEIIEEFADYDKETSKDRDTSPIKNDEDVEHELLENDERKEETPPKDDETIDFEAPHADTQELPAGSIGSQLDIFGNKMEDSQVSETTTEDGDTVSPKEDLPEQKDEFLNEDQANLPQESQVGTEEEVETKSESEPELADEDSAKDVIKTLLSSSGGVGKKTEQNQKEESEDKAELKKEDSEVFPKRLSEDSEEKPLDDSPINSEEVKRRKTSLDTLVGLKGQADLHNDAEPKREMPLPPKSQEEKHPLTQPPGPISAPEDEKNTGSAQAFFRLKTSNAIPTLKSTQVADSAQVAKPQTPLQKPPVKPAEEKAKTKQQSKFSPIILFLIIGLLAVLGGVYYFFISSDSVGKQAEPVSSSANASAKMPVFPPQTSSVGSSDIGKADPLEDKAITIVKSHNIGNGKGTVSNWLQNAYIGIVGSGGKEEWSATALRGNSYVVQYRILKAKTDPIIYQFEVDVEKNKILRGINNLAIELLGKLDNNIVKTPVKTAPKATLKSKSQSLKRPGLLPLPKTPDQNGRKRKAIVSDVLKTTEPN